jgi:hypothetical protein
MKPRCDVAEGPTWHSPRSGLVQLSVERMAGPRRFLAIQEWLEGQPSLTFTLGRMRLQ